jgi:hypothetical protein
VALVDLRQSFEPALALPAEAIWYAEGTRLETAGAGVEYAPRFAVPAGRSYPLVLWSIPPSPELMRWLFDNNDSGQVYLCARFTADDAPAVVLQQVAGMVKYALNRSAGQVDVKRMAARLGQTEGVVRTALLLLARSGKFRLIEWLDADLVLVGAAVAGPAGTEDLWTEFDALLAEVRAYRRFVARARLSELGGD